MAPVPSRRDFLKCGLALAAAPAFLRARQTHPKAMVRDRRYKLVWRNRGRGPNERFDLQADTYR